MGLTDWFGFGRKKDNGVKVAAVDKRDGDTNAAPTGPSGAGDAAVRIMDQQNAPTKVLMVQDGEYLPQVTQYALKMAQRLDCEIIALDVTDRPLQFSGERRRREQDRFLEKAAAQAADFIRQAESFGVKVEHMVEIGDPEEVTARVSEANAGIRYVLSKPDEADQAEMEREHTHVPVIDLRCSRL